MASGTAVSPVIFDLPSGKGAATAEAIPSSNIVKPNPGVSFGRMVFFSGTPYNPIPSDGRMAAGL